MKFRKFRMFLVAAASAAMLLTACEKYDDGEIRLKIADIEDRVTALEGKVTTLEGTMLALQTAVERNYSITAFSPTDKGYLLTFSNGETLELLNGEKGDQGIQGEKGDKGDTPVVTIGQNGNWYINGVDTSIAATGAQGEKGDKGDKGDTGATGEKGDKGDTGAQGEKGDKGDTPVVTIGANGNWYINGVDTGVAATGPKGDTGATGATGAQGEKGDKGDQGDKGDKGDKGAKGYTGDSFFKSVTREGDLIVFKMNDQDNTTYKIPCAIPVTIGTDLTAKFISVNTNQSKAIEIDIPSTLGFASVTATVTFSNGIASDTRTRAIDDAWKATVANDFKSVNVKVPAVVLGNALLMVVVTKANGETYIASKALTVKQLVTSISLNETTATLTLGGTAEQATTTLTATIAPENAINKAVTWSSNNPAVATVSAAGVVTGVATGTATITATAQDGSGKSASCTVTVKDPQIESYQDGDTTGWF